MYHLLIHFQMRDKDDELAKVKSKLEATKKYAASLKESASQVSNDGSDTIITKSKKKRKNQAKQTKEALAQSPASQKVLNEDKVQDQGVKKDIIRKNVDKDMEVERNKMVKNTQKDHT